MAPRLNLTNRLTSNTFVKRVKQHIVEKNEQESGLLYNKIYDTLQKMVRTIEPEKSKRIYSTNYLHFFSTVPALKVYNSTDFIIKKLIGYNGYNPLTRTKTKIDIIVRRLEFALEILSKPELKERGQSDLKEKLNLLERGFNRKDPIRIAQEYIINASSESNTITLDELESRIKDCLELEKEIIKGGKKRLNLIRILKHRFFPHFNSDLKSDIFGQIFSKRIATHSNISSTLKLFSEFDDPTLKYPIYNYIYQRHFKHGVVRSAGNDEIIMQILCCIEQIPRCISQIMSGLNKALQNNSQHPSIKLYAKIAQNYLNLYFNLYTCVIKQIKPSETSQFLIGFKNGLKKFFKLDEMLISIHKQERGLSFKPLIECTDFMEKQALEPGLLLSHEQKLQILQRIASGCNNDVAVQDTLYALHGLDPHLKSMEYRNKQEVIEAKINTYLNFIEFICDNKELKKFDGLDCRLNNLIDFSIFAKLSPDILKRIVMMTHKNHPLIKSEEVRLAVNKKAVEKCRENFSENPRFRKLDYRKQGEILEVIRNYSIDKELSKDIHIVVLSNLPSHYFYFNGLINQVCKERFKSNIEKYLNSINYFKLKDEEIACLDFTRILESDFFPSLDFNLIIQLLNVILRSPNFHQLVPLAIKRIKCAFIDGNSGEFNQDFFELKVIEYLSLFKNLLSKEENKDYLDLNLIIEHENFFKLKREVILNVLSCIQIHPDDKQKENFIQNSLLKVEKYYLRSDNINEVEFISNFKDYLFIVSKIEEIAKATNGLKKFTQCINYNLIVEHPYFLRLSEKAWEDFIEFIKNTEKGKKLKSVIATVLKCLEYCFFSQNNNEDKEEFLANCEKYLDFQHLLKKHGLEREFNFKAVVENKNFIFLNGEVHARAHEPQRTQGTLSRKLSIWSKKITKRFSFQAEKSLQSEIAS